MSQDLPVHATDVDVLQLGVPDFNPNLEIRNRACARARSRENSPLRCHAGRNRTVAERSGSLLGADGQQIEDEHEHDSLTSEFGFNGRTVRKHGPGSSKLTNVTRRPGDGSLPVRYWKCCG